MTVKNVPQTTVTAVAVKKNGMVGFANSVLIMLLAVLPLFGQAQVSIDATGYVASSSTNNFVSTATGPNGDLYGAWKYSENLFIGKWNGSAWTTHSITAPTLMGSGWTFSDDISLVIDSAGVYHLGMRATNNSGGCCSQPRGVVYIRYNGSWTYSMIESYSHPNGWLNADNPSLALSPSGNPEIAFEFTNSESYPSGYYEFRLAVKNGSSWTVTRHQTVDRQSHYDISDPSLKIDAAGHRHISYMKNNVGDSHDDLYYATDKSGSWVYTLVKAGTPSVDNAEPSWLVLDPSGNPVIANNEAGPTDDDVNLYTNSSGSFTTVDPGVASGYKPCMATNSNGDMVVLYTTYDAISSSNQIGLAYNTGSGWSNYVFSETGIGSYKSIALNDDGEFVILYHKQITSSDRRVYYLLGTLPGGGGTPNNAPVFTNQTFSIAENSANNTVVGTFGATDADSDPLTYSILSGNTGNAFKVSGAQLQVNTSSQLDYETTTSYTLTVRTTDGTDADTATITVNVTDVNEAPVVSLISTGTLLENAVINTNGSKVHATDPEGQSLTFTIISGNTNNAWKIDNTGQVQVNNPAALDYETQHNWTLSVNISDGINTINRSVTADISDLNEAPVLLVDTFYIDENSVNGTFIGQARATDPEAGAVFFYSITGPFSIASNGNITVNGSLDYETTALYNPYVYVRDSWPNPTVDNSKVVIIVNDVTEGPTMTAQSFSINENSNNGSAVGTVSATGTGTITYTLLSQSVSGAFDVDTAGAITVVNTAMLNYELNDTITLVVRATDNSGTADATMTIAINNVNEAPVMSNIAVSLDEDNYLRLVTGGGNPYSDADGDALAGFRVTTLPVNGVLFIHAGSAVTVNTPYNLNDLANLIYQPNANFNGGDNFTFEGYDGALYSSNTSTVSITVNAVNDIPVLSDAHVTTAEEQAVTILTQFVGNEYFDADSQAYQSFKVVTLPVHGTLAVNSNPINAGDVLSAANSYLLTYTPDADFNGSDSFGFNMSDGTAYASADATVNITVTPENDAPADITLSSAVIDENKPAGTVIGTLSTTDTDAGDAHVYQILNPTGEFILNGDQLLSNSVFNHELATTVSVDVLVSDLVGESTTKTFTITVNDKNDAPSSIQLSNNTVDETMSINSLVGILNADDEDAIFTHTFALVAGNGDTDNASFVINNNLLQSNTIFNYNTQQTYSIRIQVTDDQGATFEETFAIHVTDVNGAPTDVALSNTTVSENSGSGVVVGSLTSVDPDSPESFTYELTAGQGDTDNGSFSVAGDVLYTAAGFDFETQASYSIRLKVTDSGNNTFEKAFTISIVDVNETPIAATISNTTVSENQPVGAVVGTLSTTDVDAGDTHSYSLVQGAGSTGNASFSINGGQLVTSTILDYETQDTYSVRVRSTDGAGHSIDEVFTINVANTNDGPTGVTLDVLTIDENSPVSTAVGNLGAISLDHNTYTFTLVSGTGDADNGSFTILNNKLQVNDQFDFETRSTYSVRVRATDQDQLWAEETFTITIGDVNEAPGAVAAQTQTIGENMPAGTVVATLNTSDVDAGDSHTYALVSGAGDADNSWFTISGNHVVTAAPMNYEVQSVFSFRVESTDAGGLKNVTTAQINITDINDAPAAATMTKTTSANTAVQFLSREFAAIWSDEDGDYIDMMMITAIPANGELMLKGSILNDGDLIDAWDISYLKYVPYNNFAGHDEFNYVIYDGTTFSDNATVNITVNVGRNVGAPAIASGSFSFGGFVNNREADPETGIEDVNSAEKATIKNFPNPFNDVTNIRYELPGEFKVSITVFDLLGKKLTVLANEVQPAGEHTLVWDGTDANGQQLTAGKYICQIIISNEKGETVSVKAIGLMKVQ